ncbi:MAG: hypothetical protein IJW70_00920 [Clostridia bacterium]|nr:hypothetical protein [Clostridia bacterium]
MKQKKLITKLLLWLVCLGMLAGTFSMLAMAEGGLPRSISVQNGTGTRGAVAVGKTYSYRAIVNGSFDGFGYCIPTYSTSDAECTISMYKWEGTYEETVAKEPIASQRFAPLKDNDTNWVRFDAQPAGEYLFHISDPKGKVGVWTNSNPKDSKGFLYLNGVEQRGEPELHFNFENDNVPEEPFGTCQASADAHIAKSPYKTSKGKTPSSMSVSGGMRLNVNAPFSGVEFNLATYTATDMEVDISVYAWKDTYSATVAAEPLATERILLIDNSVQGISFKKLPAGDYLFLVHNANKSPAVYTFSEVTGFEGYVYKDGFPASGSVAYPDMQVVFTEEAANGDYFSECSEPKDTIDGNHTAPEQYVIPEDSLIYTHPVLPDTWVFTDGLGRTSLTYEDVGPVRDNKTVAMFYWTWHIDGFVTNNVVNLQEYCEKYPDAIRDYNNEIWKQNESYWWNESIYGFYRGDDPWVLRKQAELLTNAGVDVIFTDNTNGDHTWYNSYNALLKEWDDAMTDGLKTPKLSFMLPFWDQSYTNMQVASIYQDLFRAGRYPNLWYYLDGKPMIMAIPASFNPGNSPLEKEISNYFTFRAGQPGYVVDHTDLRTWGWLSMYPQAKYYASSKDKANGIVEQITVGVAMNHDYGVGALAAMSGNNIAGRSYTSEYKDRYVKEGAEASKWGYNFAEQWNYALEVDPSVVFVTGWNEFRVGRYEVWPEESEAGVPNAFPDQFNDEFSRDIEPTKGNLKDHYYYQLVNFVRQYKGANPIPTPSAKTTIDLGAGQDQWKAVEPYFGAYIGNTEHRDHAGYGTLVYTETSGRNDIIGAQVARDDEYVYFNVECAADITPYTDALWMTLYIDSDQQNQGWETFEYVINKSAASADTVVLEKFTGNGYESTKVADCSYTVDGRYMTVKVAKSDLGLSGDNYTINFSWTDNVHDEGDYTKFSGDIMDFYISGDVAPGARFKFSYVSGKASDSETESTDADTTAPDLSEGTTEAPAESETEGEQKSGCKSFAAGAAAVAMAAAAAVVLKKKKD